MDIGTTLLILITGTLNAVCFYIGAKVGQKVVKGEPIELPTINPIKIAQEHNERRIAAKEQDKLDTILENIENYNGTSAGQKDVPR
jgi:hypothetical protein